jgi:hypothetical protein
MVNNITDEMARFIWVAIGIQARRRLESSAQPLTIAIKKSVKGLYVRSYKQAERHIRAIPIILKEASND